MIPKISFSAFNIGLILAIIGTGLFSLKSILIKLAYAQGLNTDSVLMLRMAIALPLYLIVLIYLTKQRKVPDQLSINLLKITFLGFIGYYLSSWLDLKGLEYISAQLERLTLFTYPIMVAIFGALFFKTPLTRKIIVSLTITYSGLLLVFYKELTLEGNHVILGTIFVALAALSFSLYVLFGKQEIKKIGSVWFTGLAMSISSIFVLIHFSIFNDFSYLNVTPMAWLWLVLLAVFSTVIPSFMISEAINKIGPTQTGIVGSLGPIMTMGLAIWILNEPFTIWHAIGILFVIGGVSLLSYKPK